MSLLRKSVPRLARLNGPWFEDLATGETRTLVSSPPSEIAGDGTVFGRFATMADRGVIATGTLVQLDEEAVAWRVALCGQAVVERTDQSGALR